MLDKQAATEFLAWIDKDPVERRVSLRFEMQGLFQTWQSTLGVGSEEKKLLRLSPVLYQLSEACHLMVVRHKMIRWTPPLTAEESLLVFVEILENAGGSANSSKLTSEYFRRTHRNIEPDLPEGMSLKSFFAEKPKVFILSNASSDKRHNAFSISLRKRGESDDDVVKEEEEKNVGENVDQGAEIEPLVISAKQCERACSLLDESDEISILFKSAQKSKKISLLQIANESFVFLFDFYSSEANKFMELGLEKVIMKANKQVFMYGAFKTLERLKQLNKCLKPQFVLDSKFLYFEQEKEMPASLGTVIELLEVKKRRNKRMGQKHSILVSFRHFFHHFFLGHGKRKKKHFEKYDLEESSFKRMANKANFAEITVISLV